MTDEVKKILQKCKLDNTYTLDTSEGLRVLENFILDKTGKVLRINPPIDLTKTQIFDYLIGCALNHYLPLIETTDAKETN